MLIVKLKIVDILSSNNKIQDIDKACENGSNSRFSVSIKVLRV